MITDYELGKLYKAAIDAYMFSEEFCYGINTYAHNHPEVMLQDALPKPYEAFGYVISDGNLIRVISVPGDDGFGGGQDLLRASSPSGYPSWDDRTDRFELKFDQIRRTISQLFQAFVDTPHEYDFAAELSSARLAINTLALDFTSADTWAKNLDREDQQATTSGVNSNVLLPPGAIEDHLRLIVSTLGNRTLFAGSLAEGLLSRYGRRFAGAVAGLSRLQIIYGSHIAAQSIMWGTVRPLVHQAYLEALEGFHAVKEGGSFQVNWKIVAEVLGTALKIGAIITKATGVAAPVSVALDVASTGVSAVSNYIPEPEEPEVPTAGGSHAEVMEFLTQALKDIKQNIRAVEQSIHDNASSNISAIYAHAEVYDLTGQLLDIQAPGSDWIKWDTSQIPAVCNAMTGAAQELEVAASAIGRTSTEQACSRSVTLGIGHRGPSPKMDEFGALLKALLVALAAELSQGAVAVKAVSDELAEAESRHQAIVDRTVDEVDLVDLSQWGDLASDEVELDPLRTGAPSLPPLDVAAIFEGVTPSNSYFQQNK